MLLVQLGINSTRDVWKFAKLDSPRRLVQFWQNFQTSLVLLIPNCTRHRMITYTNKFGKKQVIWLRLIMLFIKIRFLFLKLEACLLFKIKAKCDHMNLILQLLKLLYVLPTESECF
jgi:hypothetical protein